MPDDMNLNFEGKVTNKDVREALHIPIFISKSENTDNKEKEDNDE